jgi:hypothetical protein
VLQQCTVNALTACRQWYTIHRWSPGLVTQSIDLVIRSTDLLEWSPSHVTSQEVSVASARRMHNDTVGG